MFNEKAPATKYRQVSKDEPLHVMYDPGNTDVKAMIHGRFGEEIVFPQRVYRVPETEYATLKRSYRGKRAQFEGSAIFGMDGQGFSIGLHAERAGDGEQRRGTDKYDAVHMGALMAATLLQLYPDGHEDVRITITHPADVNEENMRKLHKAIKRTFNIEIADGRKVRYIVTKIYAIEEPVAGFQTFMLNTRGDRYARPRMEFRPGTQYLVWDFGGWLVSACSVLISRSGIPEVNMTNIPVFQRGIQNVMDQLQTELKADEKLTIAVPELLDVQEIPAHMLTEALMSDYITIKGKVYNCEIPVEKAMRPIASFVDTQYKQRFESGLGYSGIIVTGGGGGILYEYVQSKIFKHDFCFTAEEDIDKMRFSQVRGTSKGFIHFLVANGN